MNSIGEGAIERTFREMAEALVARIHAPQTNPERPEHSRLKDKLPEVIRDGKHTRG